MRVKSGDIIKVKHNGNIYYVRKVKYTEYEDFHHSYCFIVDGDNYNKGHCFVKEGEFRLADDHDIKQYISDKLKKLLIENYSKSI